MHKIALIIVGILMSSLVAMGQKSGDIGLFLGGSYYMGDINRTKLFYRMSPAVGIVYRKNFNAFYSLKFNLTRGELQGYDKDGKSDVQKLRNASFEKNQVLEFASQLEFNFFEIAKEKDKEGKKYSPYINVGIAMFQSDYTNGIQAALPFGVGIKYKIRPKFEIDIEWSYRKTFTDKLDNLPDYESIGIYEYRQQGQNKNNDWYSFVGINLLYNLAPKKKCPAY